MCTPSEERCNGADDDCDGRIDESGACTSCLNEQPTGQGSECDRCACSKCGDLLAQCSHSGDQDWNNRCSALLECFGQNAAAGKCGAKNDCYQSGNGPCSQQVNMATTWQGASCATDPVRTPCGSFELLHQQCLKNACGSVCAH
jgi:hypothetical protein